MMLFTNRKVLIAEDDSMFREILVTGCEQSGFQVVAAVDNGREAIQQAIKHKPDVVLLDIEMPHYTGLEVACVLHAKLPELSLVLISGCISRRRATEALRMGVSGLIDKTTDSVRHIIRQAIPCALQGERYISQDLQKRLLLEATNRKGREEGEPACIREAATT
ncbi:MAG: response regulator transcription factor [Opitutales bacterium]